MRAGWLQRLVALLPRGLITLILALCAGFAVARMENPAPKPAPRTQPFGYVAPVALSSPNVASGAAILYQPWFDMGDYSGDLNAFLVNNQGQLPASPAWQAGKILDAAALADPQFWDLERTIIAGDEDGRGIPFRFQRLSAAQQALVGSEDVVNYVRGKRNYTTTNNSCGKPERDDDGDDDKELEKDDDNGDDDAENDDDTDGASKSHEAKNDGQPNLARADGASSPALVTNADKTALPSAQTTPDITRLSDDSDDDSDDDKDDDDNQRPSKPCKPAPAFFERSLLGALIHTRPIFVGPPREGYPFDNYTGEFARDLANRTPIVYAGANDGLLHAFNAETGEEIFGYVPSMVLGSLPDYAGSVPSPTPRPERDDDKDDDEGDDDASRDVSSARSVRLMSASFSPMLASESKDKEDDDNDDDEDKKKNKPKPTVPDADPLLVYSVDGPLNAGDAQINGAWRTVLTGGLGAGGRGYFALDVTNPAQTAVTETDASRMLLWEFTPADDADIGYSYSRVSIGRLNDNARTWVAVFGNGYQSAGGRAVLFIVDIATGRLIKKLVAGGASVGTNGLSSPTLVDINADYTVDYAYAGDLNGNVWKFDLSGNSPDQWRVAFEGQPLFTTRTAGNDVQSITTAPAISFHPFRGLLVTVATGRLLTDADLESGGDSVYGLWDDETPITRDAKVVTNLLTESAETQQRTAPLGFVDWTLARGWRIDLPANERVLTDPLVRAERIQFTSTNPVTGNNWLIELDASTGGAPRLPIFGFDNTDSDPTGTRVVGIAQGKGLVSRPTFAMLAAGADSFYVNRIQAVNQGCVAKRPPRKKQKDKDDDGSDDGDDDDDEVKNSKNHRQFSRPFSGGDDRDYDDDGDDDGGADAGDDVCVTPPPPPRCVRKGDRDDDGDDDGSKKGDDDSDSPRPSPEPPQQVGTQGGVNFGGQEGKNIPGRKLWREVIPISELTAPNP